MAYPSSIGNLPHEPKVPKLMPGTARFPFQRPAAALLAIVAAGCTEAEPTVDRFEATGELVALSGGDAGARGACITCHGLNGEGDGNLSPRLAGLNPGYIARQLDYFSEGQRRHPQMVWIADHLDWPSRQKVADYYASLPVPEMPATQDVSCDAQVVLLYHEGAPERGIASCASCHGDDGEGVGQGNPPVANQPAPYLEAQLRHWRQGERYGDHDGVMQRISSLLRDEELLPLARYASQLSGSSVNPERSEACPRTRRPDPRSGA